MEEKVRHKADVPERAAQNLCWCLGQQTQASAAPVKPQPRKRQRRLLQCCSFSYPNEYLFFAHVLLPVPTQVHTLRCAMVSPVQWLLQTKNLEFLPSWDGTRGRGFLPRVYTPAHAKAPAWQACPWGRKLRGWQQQNSFTLLHKARSKQRKVT